MSIYFKFKSARDFDSLPVSAPFVSVRELKEKIYYAKGLDRGKDFDLVVSDAQTDQDYADESAMIPKNASVLIRRIPGWPRKNIIVGPEKPNIVKEDLTTSTSTLTSSTMRNVEEPDWDDFGNDVFAIPEVVHVHSRNPVVTLSPACKADEDDKIKAFAETSALDWNSQVQSANPGRMMAGRDFGRGVLGNKIPPAGYICYRCKVAGHFIQHCPTNGDPNYDIKRLKPPSGIPKSMLMTNADGTYKLPNGTVAVLKPNEVAFEKAMVGIPSSRRVSDIPPELRCSFCKEAMKDAVMSRTCCFRSFCDRCIRDYIINNSKCICGVSGVLTDDLVPNYALRKTISSMLESTTSSTENLSCLTEVRDMESDQHVRQKVPSLTRSATSLNEEARGPPSKELDGVLHTSERKDDTVVSHFTEKKCVRNAGPSEIKPESAERKGAISVENVLVPAVVQEELPTCVREKKKNNKKTVLLGNGPLPGNAPDMQWSAYQNFGAQNFYRMPLGYPGFSQYWDGGMPVGFNGYMAPYNAAMPYMGPINDPRRENLPEVSFYAQGHVMPGFPQSNVDIHSIGTNQGPPSMSRKEFEDKKANLRQKREVESLSERVEHSRDRSREASRCGNGSLVMSKEARSSGNDARLKAKPVCLLLLIHMPICLCAQFFINVDDSISVGAFNFLFRVCDLLWLSKLLLWKCCSGVPVFCMSYFSEFTGKSVEQCRTSSAVYVMVGACCRLKGHECLKCLVYLLEVDFISPNTLCCLLHLLPLWPWHNGKVAPL